MLPMLAGKKILPVKLEPNIHASIKKINNFINVWKVVVVFDRMKTNELCNMAAIRLTENGLRETSQTA